ncbi:MAG: OB-fold nucleic acid binding domain-containing protein [Desulfosarcinaceae bacterium]
MAGKNLSHKKDGNPYLTLVLGDKSGQVKGVAWDNVEQLNAAVKAGDFILVDASASEYRGTLQVVVRNMAALPADAVDPEDYLPATARNVDHMFERLKGLTESMTSQPLRELMEAFWRDSDFVAGFKRSPAAKHMHHAYLGGLLEHTLSMALLGDKRYRQGAGTFL